jgi:hypothetical protein
MFGDNIINALYIRTRFFFLILFDIGILSPNGVANSRSMHCTIELVFLFLFDIGILSPNGIAISKSVTSEAI